MIRENFVTKPGSIAELVAEESVCWKCEDTVKLPGRKCADCQRFFCDRCLPNVVMSDCPKCSFGMINQINKHDQSLILALLFKCRRKHCSHSQRKTLFPYLKYLDHHSEHLEQDCCKPYKSRDQPQNLHDYDGMPSCSNLVCLKKQEDVHIRVPVEEEQKVPNFESQKIEQKVKINLDQQDAKLRRVNNPWKIEEDEALVAIMTQTKGDSWPSIAGLLSAKGFELRSQYSVKSRWVNHLNVDKSEMRKEEEQLISELYRQKFSWTQIAKQLVRRSPIWVQNQFQKIFRKHLRIIKKHLKLELTNDQICQQVKDKKITLENLQHLTEEDRNILEPSLQFVHDDHHGQKFIKQLLENVKREQKRNPVKHNKQNRKGYYARKQRLLLQNPPAINPHPQRSQSHSSSSTPPNSPNSPKSEVKIGIKRSYYQK